MLDLFERESVEKSYERLEFEVFDDNMGHFFMHKQVNEFRQIRFPLDNL